MLRDKAEAVSIRLAQKKKAFELFRSFIFKASNMYIHTAAVPFESPITVFSFQQRFTYNLLLDSHITHIYIYFVLVHNSNFFFFNMKYSIVNYGFIYLSAVPWTVLYL